MSSTRFLGLELAGAKNDKTAVAVLEFYPREKKIFVLDVHERVFSDGEQSSDEALIELLDELKPEVKLMGVNVPLTLPPCFECKKPGCARGKCSHPAVKWMHAFARRHVKLSPKKAKARQFTPYTQRPVELWARHALLPKLPDGSRFEIDEAFGGTKAPLTARMHYLKRSMKGLKLIEAWPKLTVALLAQELGLHKRLIGAYRHLEEGAHARGEILDRLTEQHGVFIYERDVRKLAGNLSAFDAFICAYTALLSSQGQCQKPPAGFPTESGWIQFPRDR